MTLTDTNIFSGLMLSIPSPAVPDWSGRQDTAALHISVFGDAKLRRDSDILSAGKRRDRLSAPIFLSCQYFRIGRRGLSEAG